MASVWMSSRVASVCVYILTYTMLLCESEWERHWLRIGENASVAFVTNIDNERTNEQERLSESERRGQNERNSEKNSQNFELIYPYTLMSSFQISFNEDHGNWLFFRLILCQKIGDFMEIKMEFFLLSRFFKINYFSIAIFILEIKFKTLAVNSNSLSLHTHSPSRSNFASILNSPYLPLSLFLSLSYKCINFKSKRRRIFLK